VRELSGFEVTPLAGTEAATTPFFSPDGRWVAFWRAEDRILRRVAVAGGAPIEIAPTDTPHFAVWGPNDEIVIDANVPDTPLWSIPVSGGSPRPIAVRDRTAGEWLSLRGLVPGGNDLLVASRRQEGSWLEILSRQTGTRRRVLRAGGNLVAKYTPTGHLVYAAGDALFAVPVNDGFAPVGAPAPVMHGIDHYFWHSNMALSDSGTFAYVPAERVHGGELAWLDRKGSVTPVPGLRESFGSVALSPDGTQAATWIVEDVSGQVWIMDLDRGTKRLFVAGNSRDPIWSRDGGFITYVSRRTDGEVLCRMRADGTGAEECPVHRSGYPTPEDWSPDGHALVFSEYTSRGDSDIWMYANGVTRPLIATPFSEQGARISPDGRFIAFEADDGGVSQVYVQPFPGPGPRVTVSTGEGSWARWARDGRRLYYVGGRRQLMVVDVQTAPVLRVGRPEIVLEDHQPWDYVGMTPDARRFLMSSPRRMEGPPELRVVLDWFDELERMAPHPR
jgi:Tol biopolymer transport system component